MIRAVRVSLNVERMAIRWAAAMGALLIGGMVVAVAGMTLVIGGRGCDVDFTSTECARVLPAFARWEHAGQFLLNLLWILPTGLGALLGAAVIAGEIDRGSAQISWPLARTRTRWMLWRVLPVALVLVLSLAALAGFAELVTRARLMTEDPGFHDYQLRSLILPARGLLAFSIGLAVGALIGRTIPALVVGVALAAAVTAGALIAINTWQLASATLVLLDDPSWSTSEYPLVVIRSAVSGPAGEGFPTIAVSEFWVWVLREAALLTAGTVAAGLAAICIVDQRSP